MRKIGFGWIAVVVLAALAAATGCTSNDVTQPSNADTQTDVNASALAVTMSGPSAAASADLIGAMVGRMGGATAKAKLAAGTTVAPPSSCPPTFDLGNGITGTCSATAQGIGTFTFSGTLVIDGVSVTIEGTLVVTPSVDQPPSGIRYAINFNASATSLRGTATWAATGDVTRDAGGQVTDHNLAMTHTVTPAGGASVVVAVVISPSRFEETVTGPRGNTIRFVLNRETMTGTIRVNGTEVAAVTITGGCAHVDFVNPELTDFTICAGT
jgi:hypothetical protein